MLKIEKFALLFVNYRYLSTKMSTVLEFCTNGTPLLSCGAGSISLSAPAPLLLHPSLTSSWRSVS